MLKPDQVAEVQRLLDEGRLSQRAIARRTGISRGSIGLIAAGAPRREPNPPADDADEPQGPPVRCPTCGGMAYLPCRLCRVRELKAQDRARRNVAAEIARELNRGQADRRQGPPLWPTSEVRAVLDERGQTSGNCRRSLCGDGFDRRRGP